MKKSISILLISLLVVFSIFGKEKPVETSQFFFGGGLGSGFNIYSSTNLDTVTGITGYTRIPLYFNIYGGLAIYDNLNVLLTFSDIFERFIKSSDYLQLNILQFYPSLQYVTPIKGLSVDLGWGMGLLIPSTNIASYNTTFSGGVEPGSAFQFSAAYTFYQISGHLLPQTGIRIIHEELINTTITSIILFANLSWQ